MALSPFCHSIRRGGIFYAKGVESTRPVVVYYGKYLRKLSNTSEAAVIYKSIIFDIGGVLVDFDPKAYLVDRLCNAEMEE